MLISLNLNKIKLKGGEFSGTEESRKNNVAEVHKKQNETLDDLLRRFRRECSRDGLYTEIKKRRYYLPPSVKKKQKDPKKIGR
jgi:small subunit ribosomal protein S21